jgi:hypothetical protein
MKKEIIELEKISGPGDLAFGHLSMMDDIVAAMLQAKEDPNREFAWNNLSKLVDVDRCPDGSIRVTFKVHSIG